MYTAYPQRDESMPYRACGKGGLKLPSITLGLCHILGDVTPMATQRDMLRTAFDQGIPLFDLANICGPPAGSAETNFSEHMRRDFKPYRNELLISSKAGWGMWLGPYGSGGGSRKYLLASLDQSLKRVGLNCADIFYSHRFDADTPLEESCGALAARCNKERRCMSASPAIWLAKRAKQLRYCVKWMYCCESTSLCTTCSIVGWKANCSTR